MSAELFLVRHAESAWNAAGRWQGHGDPPLSARGREQARALAESLAGQGPWDRLLCSDLQRACETAQALGEALGLEPDPDTQYRELEVGRWTGLTRQRIEAREPELLARFEAGDPDARPGGGETRGEIRTRARMAVERLQSQCPGGRLILVTHLGFIRALIPEAEPTNTDVLSMRIDALLELRADEPLRFRDRLRVPV